VPSIRSTRTIKSAHLDALLEAAYSTCTEGNRQRRAIIIAHPGQRPANVRTGLDDNQVRLDALVDADDDAGVHAD
jgi:hypothetical protein